MQYQNLIQMIIYGLRLLRHGKTIKITKNHWRHIKSLELDPDYAFSFIDLGDAYLNLSDPKNAIIAFKKAQSLDSDNEMFNYCLSKHT